MGTIQDLRGSKCTDIEWTEYCRMPQIRTDETPGERKERIWARLAYFRENNLLPDQNKNYHDFRMAVHINMLPKSEFQSVSISITIYWTKKKEYRKL